MFRPLFRGSGKKMLKISLFFGVWENLVSCFQDLLTFSRNWFQNFLASEKASLQNEKCYAKSNNFIAIVINFTFLEGFLLVNFFFDFWLLLTTLLSSNQLNRTAVAPSSQCAKNCQSDDQIRIECSRFWTKKFWFTSITYSFLQKSQNNATRKRHFPKLIKRFIKY